MLFDDYTSVPSWQACRGRHIVLTPILVKGSVSWAYCYGLESYPRSYESDIDIQPQSTWSQIWCDPQTCSPGLLPRQDPLHVAGQLFLKLGLHAVEHVGYKEEYCMQRKNVVLKRCQFLGDGALNLATIHDSETNKGENNRW
jgi:hypothetical protein